MMYCECVGVFLCVFSLFSVWSVWGKKQNIPGLICLQSLTKRSSSFHPRLHELSMALFIHSNAKCVRVCTCASSASALGLDSKNMEESPHPAREASQVGLWTLTAHPPHSFRQSSVWRLREEEKQTDKHQLQTNGKKGLKDKPGDILIVNKTRPKKQPCVTKAWHTVAYSLCVTGLRC